MSYGLFNISSYDIGLLTTPKNLFHLTSGDCGDQRNEGVDLWYLVNSSEQKFYEHSNEGKVLGKVCILEV